MTIHKDMFGDGNRKTVMVSGGFDPVHIGHIRMILDASKYGDVTGVDDHDGTVCEAIRRLKPDYFANGGDRKKHNTPEQAVCDELGVEMLWGVGGNNKANSSSDLVERVKATSKVSQR